MTQPTALDRWLKVSTIPQLDKSTQLLVSRSKSDENAASQPSQARASSEHPSPSRPSGTRIHPDVELHRPQQEDIAGLRRLNGLLLPISYPDSFYKEIISDPVAQNLTLLARWTQDDAGVNCSSRPQNPAKLIGAIRSRLLDVSEGPPRKPGPMLYISTLVLLAPYRKLGIATQMFNAVLRTAIDQHGVTSVGVHVWEANTDALEWYTKRGFREIHYDPAYYSKLSPHGARVMTRDVSVLDVV